MTKLSLLAVLFLSINVFAMHPLETDKIDGKIAELGKGKVCTQGSRISYNAEGEKISEESNESAAYYLSDYSCSKTKASKPTKVAEVKWEDIAGGSRCNNYRGLEVITDKKQWKND